MRFQHVLLGFVAVGLSIRCTPDFGDLQHSGTGGNSNTGGDGDGGEDPAGGTSGTGGTTFGGGPNPGGGKGGLGGMAGAGAGGMDAAGEGGLGGAGGGGLGGLGGFGGEAGEGGAGGAASEPPLVIPCEDGCAHLYIPFSKDQTYKEQFFTIQLAAPTDLTGAEVTARVRLVGSAGLTETAQLYCSDTEYHYFGGPSASLSTFATEEGGTLVLRPVTGPDPNGDTFDAPQVRSFGIQIRTTAANPQPVHVIVEDFVVTGTEDPVGPWTFTEDATAIAANNFQPVEGSTVTWAPPYP